MSVSLLRFLFIDFLFLKGCPPSGYDPNKLAKNVLTIFNYEGGQLAARKSNNAILLSVRQTLIFNIRLIEQVLKLCEIKLALSQDFLSLIFIPLNSHASIARTIDSYSSS